MAAIASLPIAFNVHPLQYANFTTQQLREFFLLENLSKQNNFNLTYTHLDRLIVGTIIPTKKATVLPTFQNLKSNYFLERREMGVINIGGDGVVIVDGKEYALQKYDCIYIGMGSQKITFKSKKDNQPAFFYILSAPAHKTYPTKLLKGKDATPTKLGSQQTSNERTVYKYIYLDGVQSCQLVMGLTVLSQGSVWNTMPSHVHDRRSEIYFYFDVDADQRVMHFMGQPNQTKNLVVANHQAVLSPSWSIHSGCGTANYSFIWGMAGENKDYADMDAAPSNILL